MNHSVHFHAIPCIITCVTKEHESEDNIMFTKVPGALRVKSQSHLKVKITKYQGQMKGNQSTC